MLSKLALSHPAQAMPPQEAKEVMAKDVEELGRRVEEYEELWGEDGVVIRGKQVLEEASFLRRVWGILCEVVENAEYYLVRKEELMLKAEEIVKLVEGR